MTRLHRYLVSVAWTGNQGTGTSAYTRYSRDHAIGAAGKPDIDASADPAFRGDPARWNPEELLVASLSSCHQLWYLHLCAEAGIIVTAYRDEAEGTMQEDGGGRFTEVCLRPRVTIIFGDQDHAVSLHHTAHERCFIANSVNFPLKIEPQVDTATN